MTDFMPDVGVRINPRDYAGLMRELSQAGKAVGVGLHKVRSKAAGVIRDKIVDLAPRRRGGRLGARSLASRIYGPLSGKRANVVRAALKNWGVESPFYTRFVQAGTAGLKAVSPRPYVAKAVEATRGKFTDIVRDGVIDALKAHFGDTKAGAILRGQFGR